MELDRVLSVLARIFFVAVVLSVASFLIALGLNKVEATLNHIAILLCVIALNQLFRK